MGEHLLVLSLALVLVSEYYCSLYIPTNTSLETLSHAGNCQGHMLFVCVLHSVPEEFPTVPMERTSPYTLQCSCDSAQSKTLWTISSLPPSFPRILIDDKGIKVLLWRSPCPGTPRPSLSFLSWVSLSELRWIGLLSLCAYMQHMHARLSLPLCVCMSVRVSPMF